MENQQAVNKNIPYLLILFLAIILIAAGVFYLNSRQGRSVSLKRSVVPTNANLPKEVTVRLTNTGFVPEKVTIKAGGAVRWTNESGDDNATVNSADHPTHQLHKELNLGTFSKGSTLVHIFEKPGTYAYHDHFHPARTGTITVE